MDNRICFPFTAAVGQNDVREALLLNLIDPSIGGVLIDGERGSGKSTLARSIAPLCAGPFVEAPLSVSEDRLCGAADLEMTMQSGRLCFEEGLLSKADGGVLYIDGVDLLPDGITDALTETLSSGVCRVEREGFSFERETAFSLLATTSGGETGVPAQLADHFGLYARTECCESPQDRVEIAKRVSAFERDPVSFLKGFQPERQVLLDALADARTRLSDIELTDENLAEMVETCLNAGVAGHRADIVLSRTARAVAALHGKHAVDSDDIAEAAHFVLPHRRREHPPEEQEETPPENEDERDEHEPDENDERENESSEAQTGSGAQETPSDGGGNGDGQRSQSGSKPKKARVGEDFKVVSFGHEKDRKARTGAGRRTLTKSARKSGRYIAATQQRKNDDLALDATIRAAAPYQPFREKKDVAIAIRSEDIREKVRQRRVANLLVFVVDASGSMGVESRMTETKGAIRSLLKDAYVKRDKIALVTFSGNDARVVLPPTNSTERGYKLLRELETGGQTPLCAGIDKGLAVVQSELRKRPDLMPLLIFITDGRGNVSVDPAKKPLEEALEKCEKIREIVCPCLKALAGFGGNLENLTVGIQLFDVAAAGFDVKVKVRGNINLVDDDGVHLREHQRILEGLVVAFRDAENLDREYGTRVKFGGAHEIADVL